MKCTQISLHLGDEVVAPSAGLEPDELARVVQPAQLSGTDVQHVGHVQVIQYGVFEFGSRRIFRVRELANVFTQQVHLLIDGLAGLFDLQIKFHEVHIVISFLSLSAKVKKATRLIVILELNFNRKNYDHGADRLPEGGSAIHNFGRQPIRNKTDSIVESVLCLGSPARSFIDRPGSVGSDLGGGLYLAVIDPFEQFVLIEIDLAPLPAARDLAQAGERVYGLFLLTDDLAGFVDGYRPLLSLLRLEPVYRSLHLVQFGEDLPERGRDVFKT